MQIDKEEQNLIHNKDRAGDLLESNLNDLQVAVDKDRDKWDDTHAIQIRHKAYRVAELATEWLIAERQLKGG